VGVDVAAALSRAAVPERHALDRPGRREQEAPGTGGCQRERSLDQWEPSPESSGEEVQMGAEYPWLGRRQQHAGPGGLGSVGLGQQVVLRRPPHRERPNVDPEAAQARKLACDEDMRDRGVVRGDVGDAAHPGVRSGGSRTPTPRTGGCRGTRHPGRCPRFRYSCLRRQAA
jgi:hypothetical protein